MDFSLVLCLPEQHAVGCFAVDWWLLPCGQQEKLGGTGASAVPPLTQAPVCAMPRSFLFSA